MKALNCDFEGNDIYQLLTFNRGMDAQEVENANDFQPKRHENAPLAASGLLVVAI